VFEKLVFSIILIVLMCVHIAGLHWIPVAAVDGFLGLAFVLAYYFTPSSAG
jgi:hypothetical protein